MAPVTIEERWGAAAAVPVATVVVNEAATSEAVPNSEARGVMAAGVSGRYVASAFK